MKDQDLGIFDATKKLFYDYDNIDNVIRIFETEKTIIPLMIEHHYIRYLKQKNFTKIKEIAESIKGYQLDIRTEGLDEAIEAFNIMEKKLSKNK